MSVITYNFNMLFASHATNGKSYIVDGFVKMEDESGNEVECEYVDCILEDCNEPNSFTFYCKNNITLTLLCKDEGNEFSFEALKNGDILGQEHYTITLNRFRADEDDYMWEVLGYDMENIEEESD